MQHSNMELRCRLLRKLWLEPSIPHRDRLAGAEGLFLTQDQDFQIHAASNKAGSKQITDRPIRGSKTGRAARKMNPIIMYMATAELPVTSIPVSIQRAAESSAHFASETVLGRAAPGAAVSNELSFLIRRTFSHASKSQLEPW